THRRLLFDHRYYDEDEAVDLLEEIYRQIEGDGEAGRGVVFYVDQYDPRLDAWDNTTVDNDDWDTANAVADLLDDHISVWRNDAAATLSEGGSYTTVAPKYLLIVGDDDLIPYARVADPCDDEQDWVGMNLNPVLEDLWRHDRFFSDNRHGAAEIGGGFSSWAHGYLRMAVGRLVGATAEDMRQLAYRGSLGPVSRENRLVAAQALTESDLSDEWDVYGTIQRWGYNIRNDTEQPKTIWYPPPSGHWAGSFAWSEADLQNLMRAGYGAFLYAGHGNPTGITDLNVDTLSIGDPEISSVDKPFMALQSCGVGYTYDEPGSTQTVTRKYVRWGASGIVASAGVAYYWPLRATTHFGEKLMQLFWVELLGEGYSKPVGKALMDAKSRYDPGIMWWDEDEKTVQEFLLIGVPWLRLPELAGTGAALQAETASLAAQGADASYGPPRLIAPQTYVVTATVRLDEYDVAQDVQGGFDWLQAGDLGLYTAKEAPMVPVARLPLRLPAGAEVLSGTAFLSDPVVLDDVNLPTAVQPEDGDPTSGALILAEMPDVAGIFPERPVYWR
ncbi:MAG: hypothetical protein FJZ90_19235, partial [Chloroflexi bacterium]|nr:hypothetical protein [Chloroflexota bacterium]